MHRLRAVELQLPLLPPPVTVNLIMQITGPNRTAAARARVMLVKFTLQTARCTWVRGGGFWVLVQNREPPKPPNKVRIFVRIVLTATSKQFVRKRKAVRGFEATQHGARRGSVFDQILRMMI